MWGYSKKIFNAFEGKQEKEVDTDWAERVNPIECNYDNVYHNSSIHFNWITARFQFCTTTYPSDYNVEEIRWMTTAITTNDCLNLLEELARIWPVLELVCCVSYNIESMYIVDENKGEKQQSCSETAANQYQQQEKNYCRIIPKWFVISLISCLFPSKRSTDNFHFCVHVVISFPSAFSVALLSACAIPWCCCYIEVGFLLILKNVKFIASVLMRFKCAKSEIIWRFQASREYDEQLLVYGKTCKRMHSCVCVCGGLYVPIIIIISATSISEVLWVRARFQELSAWLRDVHRFQVFFVCHSNCVVRHV